MKQAYAGLLWLAATGAAAAQHLELPPPPALPTNFRNGSYLPLDAADWQAAKLRYNAMPELQVLDAEHKADDPLVLPAAKVQAFTIGRDTFDVVRGLRVPQPAQQPPAAFARRLFRGGGFLVAEYVAYRYKPDPPVLYRLLLDRAGGRLVAVLPTTPREFRLALAAVVRDYQPLASQLELDPNVLPVQLPELLAAYGHWKQTQPANARAK